MPDAAIFADTQQEPKSVYVWLDWLEKQLPFPVYRPTAGNLGQDALEVKRSKKSGNLYLKALMPVFVLKPNGSKGILQRKCTTDYKITVIQQQIRQLLNIKRVRKHSSILAETWIGISFDEVDRMKDSRVPWIMHRWPLVDLGMTRQDCLDWMLHHNYPKPPRSACFFCPYHSDAEWIRLKTEEPNEFAKAVEWEKLNQQAASKTILEGVPFLHSSCVPLDQVGFTDRNEKMNAFRNECEGMCGV